MKPKNYLISGFLVVTLTSCFQDYPDPAHLKKYITVNASISGMQTRASNTAWGKDDAIGIYMKKSSEKWSDSVHFQNVKYITNGTSAFKPSDTKNAISLPLDGADVSFVAYYPHKTSIKNMTYMVDVSDQGNLPSIDLLYADNIATSNSGNPDVNFIFNHQLTKVIVNIIPEDSTSDLSGLSVKMTGIGTKASFSLNNGELSDPIDKGNISFNVSTDGRKAEAILLPMVTMANKELVISVGTNSYAFPLDRAFSITSFEKSTVYTYNITLTKETLTVPEATITDWITGPSENIIIGQISTPPITGGTIDDPFTIEEAINNEGKTQVWVKGFIVGYYSSNTYKSFVNNVNAADSIRPTSNIALAATANETDSSKTFPIQLSTSPKAAKVVRDALNLQEHPENLGKEAMIRGDLESYFGTIGLKNTDMAIIDGDTIGVE